MIVKSFLNIVGQLGKIELDDTSLRPHNDSVRLYARDRGVLVLFPSLVLKSSASAIDANSAAKIASAVCHCFTRAAILPLCFPHGNDKVICSSVQ
jgi:hypothetical protein